MNNEIKDIKLHVTVKEEVESTLGSVGYQHHRKFAVYKFLIKATKVEANELIWTVVS